MVRSGHRHSNPFSGTFEFVVSFLLAVFMRGLTFLSLEGKV